MSWQGIRQRCYLGKQMYFGVWWLVMLIIWSIPIATIGIYDTAIGQGFLPSSLPKLGNILTTWNPNWFYIWLLIGVILFLFATFEGAYRIIQNIGKPTSLTSAVNQMSDNVLQGFDMVVNRLDKMIESQDIQPKDKDQTIAILNATTEKPKLIAASEVLSTIHIGSRQTFSGLSIGDSPIFIKVPIGYAGITITPILDNIVEVQIIAFIKTPSWRTATFALNVETQADISLVIPKHFTGFYTKTEYVAITIPPEVNIKDMGVGVAIDTAL